MKKLIGIPLVTATLLLSGLGAASAQQTTQEQPEQSDYEIYQSFSSAWSQIQGGLDLAGRPSAADSLIGEISELEDRFAPHRELLDEVLYPRTYRGMMDRLRSRAVDIRARLAEIQSLNNRIERMNRRLASYDEQMQHLGSRTDSLQRAMQSSAVEKRELQQLAAEYRRSVERRDAIVLSIVDSMTATYGDLPPNQEQMRQGGTISEGGGPLDMLERVARRNAAFLEESSNLEVMDYLRMSRVQREFTAMWKRLDEQLMLAYGEDEQQRDRIQEHITQWKERLDNQLWMAVNRDLKERNIPMAEVNSSGELYRELDSYLDRSLERADEESGEEIQKTWQSFDNFWTDEVQMRWAEYTGEEGLLTHQQLAELDTKVDQWGLQAQPESNLFAWLFGASMFLWLLTGLLLARRNGDRKDERAEDGTGSRDPGDEIDKKNER